jgi:hypothetical protein
MMRLLHNLWQWLKKVLDPVEDGTWDWERDEES